MEGWTDKKKETHLKAMEDLTLKVEQGAIQRKKSAKSIKLGAPATQQRAPPMKDDHIKLCERLIYARAVMDAEFEKCLNLPDPPSTLTETIL